MTVRDLSGQKFGRWTVIARAENYKSGGAQWRVRCDCSAERVHRGMTLTQGGSTSCGCWNRELRRAICIARNTTHGLAGTPEHYIWQNMRGRCNTPSAVGFENYGGRGIRVCERWSSFENFLADMGPRPSPKHSIDRDDVNGHYEPGNCRWATREEQANNTRRNHRLTHDGRTMTVMQWSRATGIHRKTIERRLEMGWTVDAAVTKPADPAAGRFMRKAA